MNVSESLKQAAAQVNAGQHAAARPLLESVLRAEPENADALHLLGIATAQAGQPAQAIALIERALQRVPHSVPFLRNLSLLLLNTNHPADAQRALDAARMVLAERPGDASFREIAARAAHTLSLYREAADAWQWIATNAAPTVPLVHHFLGLNRELGGDRAAALAAYQEALRLEPDQGDTIGRLGKLLPKREMVPVVVAALRHQLKREPDSASVKAMLGSTLIDAGQITEACDMLGDLVATQPGSADALRRYAKALTAARRIDEALAIYDRFLAIEPNDAITFGAMLMTSLYRDPDEPPAILARHRRFQSECIGDVAQAPLVKRSLENGRRLRIGYVSGDFVAHSVGYFIEPLLAAHDLVRFDIICFNAAPAAASDEATARMRGSVTEWHEIEALNDDAFARCVAESAIDVLIDLSGHTTRNRLKAFARRLAPVQITYLGYPHTTGLAAMDFRITDLVADPPGETDAMHVERLLRLPEVFALGSPIRGAPDVSAAPSQKNGYVTASCVCTPAKITKAVLAAWAKAMRDVPTLRLLLIGNGYDDVGVRDGLLKAFDPADRSRIEFVGGLTFAQYLAIHARIDLMLDTFPFNGHTTTVQNLWMGVPVVTCAGKSHRSRMAASVLTAIGLTELIATDDSEYANLIVGLTRQPDQLAAWRVGLRERMRRSPLFDATAFARAFEKMLLGAFESSRAGG